MVIILARWSMLITFGIELFQEINRSFLEPNVWYFHFYLITIYLILLKHIKAGPFYATYKDVYLDKQSGSSWFFNEKVISNITDNDLLNPHVINHHRHLTATSYLIINSMSQRLGGRYKCVVNGNISIKNVSILVFDDDSQSKKDRNSSNSKNSDNILKNSKSTVESIFISLLGPW